MNIKGNKGITLTELMMTIALLGIIIPSVSLVLYIGYKSYYVEKDTMQAQQHAKEIMDMIVTDLRRYDNINTYINEIEKKLVIKEEENEELIYTYSKESKNIYRNNEPIIEYGKEIKITNFKVEEIDSEDFDNNLFSIGIFVKAERTEEIKLETLYRRRVKVLSE
ncbi:prepilin-type N-terminal cleavage/methylation domain-containing protein [Herbivorax sp. ANBcel31]|uniref:type II secretion system protein n=1 Tax=Herbivorax sp. ANBcel31 TaxID=3069754 RepID=UPI0027B08C06|nr:prepilin-type N-terminal cleavage/methylation domain-containing protein [Herbivorax sp. ANBcel31]MDQ2085288.1 prepilin-type N-terminal cleavage/methylation domain-containing protein [Herbivorax sp. ANBcel31]